ncbi:hypothetical protein MAE30S32_48410 [Microcystis aeruginosa 11-30S32]|uniref:Uncharacterized protein n=1 Tax=Microcystis aeruginosa 11-30S32 TaxID=2358142 RepID=A0A510PR82_MICAE|nr:hypothetical protein MAE30S32_48410 [Microcystis aeruginosa 11-30S32]
MSSACSSYCPILAETVHYKFSVLLRSAFGIAIITNQSDYLQRQVRIIVGLTAKLSRHD